LCSKKVKEKKENKEKAVMEDIKKTYSKEEKTKYFERYLKIMEKDRYFIGRCSCIECILCGLVINGQQMKIFQFLELLRNSAGIHITNPGSLMEYTNTYMDAIHRCDLLGTMEEASYQMCAPFYTWCKNNIPNKEIFPACCLEPFYFFEPCIYNIGTDGDFSTQIEGKTLLIISSHINTIKQQLSKLDLIFSPYKIFKNNKFIILKPPMAIGDASKEWSDHFGPFKESVNKQVFDIALVSCGGYGMPICDYIYTEMKKSCIYMGGALQLLFGIMGRRWENNEVIKKHRNQHWIYPLASDVPLKYKVCEGGCYWR